MITADAGLLRYMWKNRFFREEELRTSCGRKVEVISTGHPGEKEGVFVDCEVHLDGAVHKGNVLVTDADNPMLVPGYYGCVLCVVPYTIERALPGITTRPVPQLVLRADESMLGVYNQLKNNDAMFRCAFYVPEFDDFHRYRFLTRLYLERLERKAGEVLEIYERAQQNWTQAFYVMYFRTMGDRAHKEAYEALAEAVPLKYINAERNSLLAIESLLLGASGFLEHRLEDDYTLKMKREFEHLRRKHKITPIKTSLWKDSGTVRNYPVMRIAQIASFVHSENFDFSKMLECTDQAKLVDFFDVEASEYWDTHYVPSKSSASLPKRVGRAKSLVLGINLVVPMMFAYGLRTREEAYRERAMEMIEGLPCESNSIINGWRNSGMEITNAAEGQAILELNNEYCRHRRCAECLMGKYIFGNIYRSQRRDVAQKPLSL